MEITINIPGLSELTSAIALLAQAMGGQAASAPAVPAPVLTAAPQPLAAVPVMVQQPAITSQTPLPQAPVPTQAQSYTMEQLAVAATQLVDAGRRAELVQLLAAFGVQALTALPKEQYGNFATSLRSMGAKL